MLFLKIDNSQISNLDYSLKKEVIQVNNFGAYSYSTILGVHTRKYHGLLAVPQPQIDQDQHVLLSTVLEDVKINNTIYELGIQKYPGLFVPNGIRYIEAIEINPITKITYNISGAIFTKEILLQKNINRVMIRYSLVDANGSMELHLKPFLAFRNKHTLSKSNGMVNFQHTAVANGIGFKLYDPYDFLYLQISSKHQEFIANSDWYYNIEYMEENERGYEYREDLWVPGYFHVNLEKGESIIFSAGVNDIDPSLLKSNFVREFKKYPLLNSMEDCLENAAKQFIIKRGKQIEIIAGYPWFGRWGRDTFIALPGLTLSRGDTKTCVAVIDSMIKDLRGSLFPNCGYGNETSMNSADAPLWFFWTLHEYANDTNTFISIWEKYGKYMKIILEGYRSGMQFNIKMQPNGLIYAGQEGKALTWMDAAYQGTVFTPRIGLPVEINALWYNAICFSVSMADLAGDDSFVRDWQPLIHMIKKSFLQTFWDDKKGYLADVVKDDVPDWAIRPNQLFSVSLPYIPLNKKQCKSVLQLIKKELLTPFGLRSLSPKEANYMGIYQGNQWHRDSAYHQGTVWPWLLGHFAEAYLKVYKAKGIPFIRAVYKGFSETLQDHGMGTVSEVYNGDAPHKPGGAISQAWSVAELIRMNKLIGNYIRELNMS